MNNERYYVKVTQITETGATTLIDMTFKDRKELASILKGVHYKRAVLKQIDSRLKGKFTKAFIVNDIDFCAIKFEIEYDFTKEQTINYENEAHRAKQKLKAVEEAKAYLKNIIDNVDSQYYFIDNEQERVVLLSKSGRLTQDTRAKFVSFNKKTHVYYYYGSECIKKKLKHLCKSKNMLSLKPVDVESLTIEHYKKLLQNRYI